MPELVTAAAPIALHGVASPFDRTREEWEDYAECLENYFIVNDIKDPVKQRAILLNSIELCGSFHVSSNQDLIVAWEAK